MILNMKDDSLIWQPYLYLYFCFLVITSHLEITFYVSNNTRWQRCPENTTHMPASNWKSLPHIEYPWPWAWIELTTLVVIVTYCIGSCISNYHTIMTTEPLKWKDHTSAFHVWVKCQPSHITGWAVLYIPVMNL